MAGLWLKEGLILPDTLGVIRGTAGGIRHATGNSGDGLCQREVQELPHRMDKINDPARSIVVGGAMLDIAIRGASHQEKAHCEEEQLPFHA